MPSIFYPHIKKYRYEKYAYAVLEAHSWTCEPENKVSGTNVINTFDS